MKKIILALSVAAAVLGMSSCQGGSSNQTPEDKAFADSLGQAFGTFMGKQMQMQVAQMKAQFGDKFNQKEFEKGIQAAMKLDTANISYMIGMSIGQQALFQVYQWNQAELSVNPAVIEKNLIASLNDTTTNGQDAYMQFQMLNGQLQNKIAARQEAKAQAEAAKNVEAAEKYIAEQKAADSAIQTSETGLSYKIVNPGEGDKVSDNANVKVIYTGRHINGEQFDSSNGEPVEFNVGGVVPGFGEGLQLLGKGGKAVLYIPGELAYGPSGQPRANIGPNEMLVFEGEVVDFTPAE